LANSTVAGKLVGIEVGRGMAASVVVLYHSARHLNKAYGVPILMGIFQFGHAGVDLFFVISGFIILFVHYEDIGRPRRLGRYVGRRLSRIMPTYWVALALTIFLSLGGGHELPALFDIVWSAALLPSHQDPLLGIAWTLQFEIVFYTVFSLLILSRIVGVTILFFWLAWIVLAKLNSNVGGGLPPSLYGFYNLEFFFGMIAALWLKNYTVPIPRMVLILGIVIFIAAAICENIQLMNGYADVSRLIYGSAAALMVVGAAETGRQSLLAVPRALQTLGTSSYSIYLFQFVFIGASWKFWLAAGLSETMPYIACFSVLAIAGVVGGIVVSRLVEYPLMRLVRRSYRATSMGAVTEQVAAVQQTPTV
jgi:exopolysaccharide production protein ExoZ